MNPSVFLESMQTFSLRKFVAIFCAALVFLTTFLVFIPEGASAKERKNKDDHRVVMFSLPRVTWKNLNAADTPNIDKVVNQGSVAAMSVRTLGPVTTPAEGYATISAGNRAAAVDSSKSSFLQPNEVFNGDIASSIYRDERGKVGFKNPIALGVGFEVSKRANKRGLFDSRIGSFASALYDHNRSIAVFGNTDTCETDDPTCFERAIGYIGSDSQGVVRYGDLSRELLQPSTPDETTQLSIDPTIIANKAKAALKKNDVVVVECSDLERVELARSRTKANISDENFKKALEQCDKTIGNILDAISLNKDQIYIFSSSAPKAQEQTTVFAAAGNGIPKGYTASSTTRREGVVTLVDIAPTILSDYKIKVPGSMGETLLDWRKNSLSGEERQNYLIKMNNQAIIRDKSVAPAALFLVIMVVLSVLTAMIAYTRTKSWRTAAQYLSLVTVCIPSIGFLMKPWIETLGSASTVIFTMAITSAILGAILLWCAKKWGVVLVILGIAVFNLLVQFGDILTGGNLQFNTVFGYSPVVAGRFAGFGNLAFAIVAISAIIVVAMVKELTNAKPNVNQSRINIGLIVFMVLVLIIDGAPYFGSDVGGVLALTPTIFVIGFMLYNKRVGIKALLISAVVTIGALITFAFIDLARPVSQRTHLGRFAESLVRGDAGIIIERKITANIRILTTSVWLVVVVVALCYVMFLFLHPERFLRKTNEAHPGFRYLAFPGIVVAVLGMVLNDSGVAIPGMMLAIALPTVSLLALGIVKDKPIESSNKAKEVQSGTTEDKASV